MLQRAEACVDDHNSDTNNEFGNQIHTHIVCIYLSETHGTIGSRHEYVGQEFVDDAADDLPGHEHDVVHYHEESDPVKTTHVAKPYLRYLSSHPSQVVQHVRASVMDLR